MEKINKELVLEAYSNITLSEKISFQKLKDTVLDIAEAELNSKKNASVLDIGCGFGKDIFKLHNRLKKDSIKYAGIEYMQERVESAELFKKIFGLKNFSFYCMDFERQKMPPEFNEKFDLVICSEVIEHLQNSDAFIGKINSMMKKGGTLIISTPNEEYFWKKIFHLAPGSKKRAEKMTKVNRADRYPAEWVFEHTGILNFKKLKELLEKNNFKIEKKKRGTMLYGGKWVDEHRVLMLAMNFLDVIIPSSWVGFSWDMLVAAKKL